VTLNFVDRVGDTLIAFANSPNGPLVSIESVSNGNEPQVGAQLFQRRLTGVVVIRATPRLGVLRRYAVPPSRVPTRQMLFQHFGHDDLSLAALEHRHEAKPTRKLLGYSHMDGRELDSIARFHT